MINRFKMAALALPLIACTALPASAGTITDVDVPYYRSVKLTGGSIGSRDIGIAGQIVLNTDSGILGSWCVDLSHYVYLNTHYTYTKGPLTTNNLTPPAALTEAQVSGIQQLAAFGNAVLDAAPANSTPYAVSSALSAAYAAGLAAYGDFSGFLADLATFSAAIQASIWNLEYGTTATSSDGHFASFMTAIAAGRSYFSNIGGYQLNLGANVQRLYTPEVPEPASMTILGVGLLALVGVARRRRS